MEENQQLTLNVIPTVVLFLLAQAAHEYWYVL
jgi:hypothetical protein